MALFILIIAVINFMNLATARSQVRSKEVGVRKVLGSSEIGLIGLMSRQILILVTISAAVAVPAAWFFMKNWLQDFAYRIDLSWYIFLAAYFAAIAIALLTTIYHSVYAITRNPAESLRYE